MERLKLKLELERIFKEFCLQDLPEDLRQIELNSIEEGDKEHGSFYDWMRQYVDFRLYVSGGDKSSMGSIGCNDVKGFLNEIVMFDNMMSDWNGCYRGEFAYECFESLAELVRNSSLDDNIKDEIYKGYAELYGMDKEDIERVTN